MCIAQHVPEMSNSELNGLAQNRFIDEETALAIVKTGYNRALHKLATNSNISNKVVDILFQRRGFVIKCILIRSGHVSSDRYEEVLAMLNPRLRAHRIMDTFVGGWYHDGVGTPANLLGQIFDGLVDTGEMRHYWLSYFARNTGCDLALLAKLQRFQADKRRAYGVSQAPADAIRKKLVELSRQEAAKDK